MEQHERLEKIKTPIDCCALPWSQTPTDHRQTDKDTVQKNLRTLPRWVTSSRFRRESANKRTDRRTDRRYQVHYLPASRSITTQKGNPCLTPLAMINDPLLGKNHYNDLGGGIGQKLEKNSTG